MAWGDDEAADRARCAAEGIHYCEPGNPWSRDKSQRAYHAQSHEVGEQEDGWPSGDIVTIECKVCGHRWQEELPQLLGVRVNIRTCPANPPPPSGGPP